MKKRLLALLLAMVMIVSMVPFQAFAEEADETPELLEEVASEEIVTEPTEEIIPETTEEIVPETTEEIVPETTEEIVPETTEETVPETTEEIIPEIMEEIIPETTVAKDPLPLMILEGMEPGEDMPQKKLRVGDTFQLKAKLTKDSAVNEGIEWFLDGNPEYGDCQPIIVQPDGTVTFNTAFDFDETGTSASGAWATVVARQVVKEGEERTVADTPAVIAMFPALDSLKMCIGDDMFGETATINAVNGFKRVSITAFPDDFGPFGGATLTLDDSNKVLKSAKKTTQHIDELDCDSEVYTVTPKKCGTFTITATAKDNPELTLTTTVTVVNETREINIKVPASARFFEAEGEKAVIMTAGQKLALSTDIPKTAADKAVTWEIIPPYYIEPKSVSESIAPEGAVVTEPEWESVVSIDEKGVLRTKAGVTMEPVIVDVRVCLTSTAEDEYPVEDFLMVMIQPPVEMLYVQAIPLRETERYNNDIQEFMDGGTNIKIPLPVDYRINEGPMLLIPIGQSENGLLYPDVSWKFSGSKKVVEFMTVDEFLGDSEITQSREFVQLRAMGARVMIPKAPGKASFTATSRDGSGAKFSATLNILNVIDHVTITPPEHSEVLHPGDQVQFSAKAYYDSAEKLPVTNQKGYWSVYERVDNWTVPPTDFATIDQKGKLTITDKVYRSATLEIVCSFDEMDDAEYAIYRLNVAPASEKTLGMRASDCGLLSTSETNFREPGEEITLLPVWVDNNGQIIMGQDDVPETVEGVSYKVSGSACAFDQTTGKLTFKKPGTAKLTVTATLDGKKQSFTYTFRCEYFTRKTEIQNKPDSGVITVVGGKTLSLKATNWYDSKTKATNQSLNWSIDWYAFNEQYHRNVYDYCWIDWNTGKLTTYPVTEDYYVTVTARTAGLFIGNLEDRPTDTVTIHIIPEKTQYRSYAYTKKVNNGFVYLTGEDQTWTLGRDFGCWVASYGRDGIEFQATDVISSNPKIATVVKDDSGIGIKIPAEAKPGKVTITVKGQYLDGYDEGGEIWKDAPSAKFTFNTVKPVTSIEIKRPTDKAGNELPLYVGKSLKLSAVINGRDGEVPATNKKLVWHISYVEPEDPRDDRGLDSFDKTTIKNGVIKVDKSTLTRSRFYYVWATSEDGNAVSNLLEIQAYAMTGAIHIASRGDWPDGNSARYLNNRTVTIKQGEELEFGALVYDVNGYAEGANPDVTWTISGKKNIVETLYDGLYEGGWTDVLGLKGLNPGTVTIKAAAKDGSRKTATFKLIVSEEKYEPDEPDEPDEPGVAKLGSVYYDDLQEALDAAVGDDTVTLLQDVSLDKTLTFDKNSDRVFLDLNGHNIHCETQRAIHVLQGWLVLRGQGTVSSNNPDVTSSVIRVGGDNTTYGADLSVDENVTISTPSCYGITVFGGSTECLSVYGTVTSTAPANNNYDGCAISTSGTDTTPSAIYIYKGNISAANTNAIYMPSGTLKVYNNPTITGLTGIYVKSGNTTIDGGTIKGTGEKKDYTYHGNGGVSTGDALVVDSCGYPNGAPTVTIKDGTFNSTNAKSVGVYKHGEGTQDAVVTINGGTFNPELN